jgi:putative hydrolase of the HAD superfamily
MSATSAVFLDAGGVLVYPDWDVVAAEIGVDIDRSLFPRAHYAGMRAVDLADTFSWWNYNHAFVEALGLEGDDVREAVNRAYVRMEWHVPIVESMDVLPALEERFAVAVVSNSDGTVDDILRRRDVKIPTIIDSHHVGVAKPDPAIFQLAMEKLGVRPDEAVHIGDSIRFDVAGARAAGVRPLHFDPFAMCSQTDHEHIASLAELL